MPDEIARQLLGLLESGHLGPGDRLPPERELARQLAVSQPALREALKILETLGVIRIQHGRGAFVRTRSLVSGFLASPWMRWLLDNAGAVLELLQVREAIEAKAAQLAAVSATDEELAALRDILARTGPVVRRLSSASAPEGQEAIAPLVELDVSFHQAIADAARNRVLADLVRGLGEALQGSREATLAIPGRARRSLQEHRAVLAALRRRDPEGARRAMARHVQRVAEEVRLLEHGPTVTPPAAQEGSRP